ncbi:MAG: hypothetical protein V1899_08825 [Planctomycetota bacterium]
MFSGRHLLLVGIIACAGLLSVHDGQRQIELGYQIGALEKKLRDVRSEIALCKIKHQALQSPKAVITKTAELKLSLGPLAPTVAQPVLPLATRPEVSRSLGSPQGARAATRGAQQTGLTLDSRLARTERPR